MDHAGNRPHRQNTHERLRAHARTHKACARAPRSHMHHEQSETPPHTNASTHLPLTRSRSTQTHAHLRDAHAHACTLTRTRKLSHGTMRWFARQAADRLRGTKSCDDARRRFFKRPKCKRQVRIKTLQEGVLRIHEFAAQTPGIHRHADFQSNRLRVGRKDDDGCTHSICGTSDGCAQKSSLNTLLES